MKFGLKDMDWEYAGALLAREGDKEQVAFLRSFLKECRSWGTSWQVEQQLASVNIKLTKEEREALKMLSFDEE